MEPIIDDGSMIDPTAWMDGGSRGLVPRDYEAMPMRSVEMPLKPRSEWSALIRQMETEKSRLSDIRLTGDAGQPIPSLDQNSGRNDGRWGYCWAHSSVHAVMALRARDLQPYVPLSAFAVAATIKNGRDEGGWGAQSLDFITSRGVPAQSFWPQRNVDLRNGTPECWANAALHKVSEGWVDVAHPLWDRHLNFDQVATCLLSRIPVVCDFNWWGHSVCALDLVETSPGQFGIRIWNSWGDGWGDKGMGVLAGSKAIPDSATAPRVVTASAA
jgi:hypothetical protein